MLDDMSHKTKNASETLALQGQSTNLTSPKYSGAGGSCQGRSRHGIGRVHRYPMAESRSVMGGSGVLD